MSDLTMNAIRPRPLAIGFDDWVVLTRLKASVFLVTSLMLVLSVRGFAQTLSTTKLDQFFDRLAEKQMAMGSLVIARDNEVLYRRAIGYGQINGTEKKPLTADSRFAIASITKTYTAVMILQVVEAGKLKLTDTGGGDNYGSWLMYLPDEKLVIAYATNAKVHPVKDIISGVVDIYFDRPFEIPAFDAFVVNPETLDHYVGIYSSPGVPNKWTVSRDGGTLLAQPGNQDAAALEAAADNKFQLLNGGVAFEFDAAKNRMTLKRGALQMVFTKEQ